MSKRFGPVEVLDGVDLVVDPGEVLAVLGPSGCGKTTLLRVLAGLEAPDAGSVTLDGDEVKGPAPTRGLVAQHGGLFPWRRLRANVEWGPRAARRPDAAAVAEELLEATGLADFADAWPHQLSGGMRQRAAIAQVLANRPPVLLLDEPFSALDAQTRLRMHGWLRQLLMDRPVATVLVTHDVDEALLLGDRVALLSVRPSKVVEVLDVGLGAGRDHSVRQDPRYMALHRDVLGRVMGT